MNPLIQVKPTTPVFLVVIGLAFFTLLSQMQAVVPPPDGCYPNFTTAEGCDALNSLMTGAGNTAVGWRSLFSDSGGSYNTGVGAGTLALNRSDFNTAVGAAALLLNTSGTENVAVGTDALVYNNDGTQNVAVGVFAMFNNVDGLGNSAFGNAALYSNINATGNIAIGAFALFNNDSTGGGVANGNTAVGNGALESNTDGNRNTAVGGGALSVNTLGSDNTAVGASALANSTGSGSIAIGSDAGSLVGSSNNVIAIGSPADDVDNSTWIGNVYGVTTQSGMTAPVIVSENGQLGTVASSERFKKDIANMEQASEAILALRPVTFHYKSDSTDTTQFGLIAEEVAKVNPTLVLPDKEGKPYSVRYDAVNTMLLNEFLKEHRKVQELEANDAKRQKEIAALTATVKDQAAQIQKVSAHLEMHKPPAKVVVNNP